MTAHEIADQLERDIKDFFPIPDDICIKAVSMLRILESECNSLREQLKFLESQVYGGSTK